LVGYRTSVILWVLVLWAVALAFAAPASADYRRLSEAPEYEQEIAIAGGEVLALSSRDGREAFTAFGLNGAVRDLVPLGRRGSLYGVAASPQAVAGNTSRGSWFGPPAGPLTRGADDVASVAVTGTTVLTLEGDAIVARTGAAPRTVARMGQDPALLQAAGPYVAVVIKHEAEDSAIVVYEIATGREVYRLTTGPADGYDLGPDGRIVFVDATLGRAVVKTATPADPTLHTIARLRATPYVAFAGDEIVLARSGAVSRIIRLRLDGTRENASGQIGRITSLAFDGTTIAFTAGHCLYGGTGPLGPPTNDGCFDTSPRVHKYRLRGRRLTVPVTCKVPPGAHCVGKLRLRLHDRTLARRRLRLARGEHRVRMRIPRRNLERAHDRAAELTVAA
jgi:hypothetical protein